MKIRLFQGGSGSSSAASAGVGDPAAARPHRSRPAVDASHSGLTPRPGAVRGGASAAPRNKGILGRLGHVFGHGPSGHGPMPAQSPPAAADTAATLSCKAREDIELRIELKEKVNAARKLEESWNSALKKEAPETAHLSAAATMASLASAARASAEKAYWQVEHKTERLDPGTDETTLASLRQRLEQARSLETYWAQGDDSAQGSTADPATQRNETHLDPGAQDDGQDFQPQAPGPSVRKGDGLLSRLGRGLRPTPGTVQFTPFVGIRVVSPTPTRAQFDTEGRLRTPQEGASKPAALPGKIESTAKAFAGPVRGEAVTAEQVRQDLAAAEADVRTLLQGGGSAGVPTRLPDTFLREDLVDRVMALAGAASPARTLASALADVVGTDVARANAALDALELRHAPREARLDAFCIERALAKTDLGHETLRALQPAALEDPGLSVLEQAVQRDAWKHALRLADQLIEGLPAGVRKPTSLQQAVQMANAALPPEQRSTLVAGTHVAGTALKSARELTAARALVCAQELLVDPAAMPHLALRSAYLAYRNGFDSEGPGTELARFQGRLAKLITYAERASGPSASFPQRVLGHGKSPLSALPFGSAGARLRNPADDFAHVAGAVGMLATQLNQQIEHLPDRRSPEAVGKALRVAAACRYQQEIAEHGWRDKVSIGRSMRNKIVADVVQSLGVDKDAIRSSGAYKELKAMGAMEAGTLRQWAAREDVEATPQLDQQLQKLEGLHNNGDWFPAKGEVTPENVMDVLRDVLLNARSTFDVRYTDTGIHGINANISQVIADAASMLAIPTAIVGPDVKAVRGRQAMVGVGSSSHGGTLFVGTDTRTAVHAGVTGVAGWSFLKDHLSVTAGMQFLPLVKDWSAPKGAMIRTRMECIGPTAPGMEPWRAKMLEVFDTIARSGPEGALPSSKAQVWDALAEHFFKDPDVSFNWMQTEASNTSSTLTGTVGARGSYAGGYKTGLMGSLGGTRFWGNAMQRQDTKGAMKVETISHSSGGGFAVSGALVESPIPLGDFSDTPGHVKQVVLPSAPVIGGSASFLTSSVGTVLRIANDGDRIIPGVTYRDLEFGNVATYLQYVDSRNNAWATSATQFDAAGEVVAQGQDVVNKFLTQVKGNADRGNQIFCERQVMTPDAARTIDEIREAFVRMTPKVESAEALKARTAKMDASIESITKDDSSWRNRFLFVMEANTRQRVVGPAYLVQAQTQTDVSHLHMTAALRAND
jgi:hypothetical protein